MASLRHARLPPAAALAIAIFGAVGTAAAQQPDLDYIPGPGLTRWPGLLAPAPNLIPQQIEPERPAPAPPKLALDRSERRPGTLVPLYISLATLNALDVHSTRRALSQGAVETNPVMNGVAGNAGALLAVKAAATTGMIYATEKMWRKNRAAAVAFMIAANSAMAWVVQHNYRATR